MSRIYSIFAITTLLLSFALVGCEDDTTGTVKQDSGNSDVGLVSKDTGGNDIKPDKTITPDQPQWPDIWGPEAGNKADLFPHPDKGYKKSPFGCVADADCFGQKCCPTPWGVKLCAPSCDN